MRKHRSRNKPPLPPMPKLKPLPGYKPVTKKRVNWKGLFKTFGLWSLVGAICVHTNPQQPFNLTILDIPYYEQGIRLALEGRELTEECHWWNPIIARGYQDGLILMRERGLTQTDFVDIQSIL